ncbi:acyl carrier protein [Lichenicola cladoniae]|uniref:Acyl carrier protein n=1 Tax=Lichenicola cladoniae TaxID=1484109 RepID=A0A6M8HL21_9PROT|nr:acyl carrier protein [Lichenicola cladoniae]NPD65150.1 acyl carrier protein [Acetobacteraceae bacterium]QKE88755.1 acyl carrier protein [Lichenicola cladoniae]
MENRIRDILSKVGRLPVPVGGIGIDDDLYDAGLSSLASVNVMLAIEQAFDIEFPDQLLTRRSFQTIRSLTGVVDALKSSAVSS